MQIYEFHISKIIIHYLDGLFGPNTLTSSQLLAQMVERTGTGRAHRYRKGHGFKSRMALGLNFFQVLFSTTRFSSVLSCEDLLISSLTAVQIYEFHISNLRVT